MPNQVRSQLREIQRKSGSIRKAIEFLQCSLETFEDAAAEGGMLRPETLEKLQKKIDEWLVREDQEDVAMMDLLHEHDGEEPF